MNLSKESNEFLKNLRVYLFSSGKNEQEIEGIVGELEDHLLEAEAEGKNVEDIIGGTPREYMEQIADEMSFDLRSWLKYIPILVIGVYAYNLLGDAIHHGIELSVLDLVGNFIILLLFLLLVVVTFKYVASTKISKTKEFVLFALLGFTPLILFFGLIYLDKQYATPTLEFGSTGNVIAIVVSIVVFIGISIWSKTWISIIIPIILFLPDILLSRTNLDEEIKLLFSGIFVPLCIGIYFLVVWKMEKSRDNRKVS